MFGHKAQAQAVVVVREMLHESAVEHGSNYSHRRYQTWRFVLEVRPEGTRAYRAAGEQKIRIPGFVVPAVGSTVRIEHDDKHPDTVKLVLHGDDRYDMALSDREERDAEKAGLDAPPGTPG